MDISAPSHSWRAGKQAAIEVLERRVGRITLPFVDAWGLASVWYLVSSLVVGVLGTSNSSLFQTCWALSAFLVVVLSPAGLMAACIRHLFVKIVEPASEFNRPESRGKNGKTKLQLP